MELFANVEESNTSRLTKRSLKVIAINVNSIIANQKRANLLKLINKESPDFLLLSETKINKTHKIEYKNYNIVRTDRPIASANSAGGGTAILIKKPIKYKEIVIYPLFKKILWKKQLSKYASIKMKNSL